MSLLELLAALVSVLAADQLSKWFVLAEPRFATIGVTRPFVSIRCIINRRLALARLSETWIVTAWIVCVALAFFLSDQEPFADNPLGAAGIGLALGGVTGNVIDLLWRRGVVDFIAIGPWPVFNIADAAIVGGFGLTVLAIS
jgi:signal peptidase II